MSKEKNYWYVLVLSNEGPVFLTSYISKPKEAFWDKNEKPLELPESVAKSMAFGLMVNFTSAFPVCSPVELHNQQYFYDKGHFEWVWNDKKEGQE